MLLASLESPAFYGLTVIIFGETSPKQLFVTPGYDFFQRSLLPVFAAVGGAIGVLFSRWRRTIAVLFLLGTLLVIAGFAYLGVYLDEHVWH
jgi:hypothetical protein